MSANAAKKKVVLKLRTMIDTAPGLYLSKTLAQVQSFLMNMIFYTSNFRQ